MMRYATGENPKVGDVVRMRVGAPRTAFRPAGSYGKVYELGERLPDPVPGLVLVDWDFKREYRDDDIMCCDLELVS